MKKAAPPAPKPAPRREMPLVQHDALMAGGTFAIVGALLMLFSAFLPWLQSNGQDLNPLDLVGADPVFALIFAAAATGAALLALTSVTMLRVFRTRSPLGRIPLYQAIVAMAGSLLVIATVLFMQQEYYGGEDLYGAGAFLGVVGAILVMAGSLLIHLMSGHRPKQPTGFQALAERSMKPPGRKEWKPPEVSVKLPTCPTCGEGLQPGWKACPNCGRALITGDMEERETL